MFRSITNALLLLSASSSSDRLSAPRSNFDSHRGADQSLAARDRFDALLRAEFEAELKARIEADHSQSRGSLRLVAREANGAAPERPMIAEAA